MIKLFFFFFVYFIQPRSLSFVGRFTFVLWMVLLGGLDFVGSRPEVASAKTVVGGREVVVVVVFSVACYAGVVDSDRMMSTRVAVRSHVACEFVDAFVSATTTAAAAAAAAAATAATATFCRS